MATGLPECKICVARNVCSLKFTGGELCRSVEKFVEVKLMESKILHPVQCCNVCNGKMRVSGECRFQKINDL